MKDFLFEAVIIMAKDKKYSIKDTMSIKICCTHYIKWARVMLPIVFEDFELVWIFCYFFLFTIIFNWSKVNFSKNLGWEGETAIPSAPCFYGSELQTFDPEIFCLGIIFPTYFVYDFSRKMFLMLCSINCPNFIVWLLLFLEISCNMCIANVCFPGFHSQHKF